MTTGSSPEYPSTASAIESMSYEQKEVLKHAYLGHLITLLALKREEYKATHDELTGLLNFRGLMKDLTRLVEEEPGTFYLVAIDLDDLKKVNDNEGHNSGNELLKEAADTFKNTLRTRPKDIEGDRRGHHDFRPDIVTLARVGGDEFVIILRDVDAENIDAVLWRLRSALKKRDISASMDGVQHIEGESAEELLNAGDQKMMMVKEMRKDSRRREKAWPKRLMEWGGRALIKKAGEDPARIKT
jgi:diguanylate cyclase (GGDEF)-like protein